MESDQEINIRKEKLIGFLKEKKEWIYGIIISLIILLSVYIRTRNLPKLVDVTTGTWTLGPDLDPYLFLRWAKEILANGSLAAVDYMRNVPLGFDTAGEMKLLAYLIVWFHKLLSIFSLTESITYSAIIFPVFMFSLGAIAFYFFAKKIFENEGENFSKIVALISTLIFVLIPSMLSRTIAGIPEKESAAFFFLFIGFYFFLEAYTSKSIKGGVIFSILAGASTGLLALVWGGVIFVFFTIPPAFFVAFILGKVGKKELAMYGIWLISSFLVMSPFSTRYILSNLIKSTSTGTGIAVLILISISLFVESKKCFGLNKKIKIPDRFISILISAIVLLILIILVLGPTFILGQLARVHNDLIDPQTNRWGLTVAENKQPYFNNDWTDNFGPKFLTIPLYFWMFILGAIFLFGEMIKKLEKEHKFYLISSYSIFLICLIFSRYSPSSALNGISPLSIIVYSGGVLLFAYTSLKVYYSYWKRGEEFIFHSFNFSYIIYFLVLTLGIIGARGGIRLIMMLGAFSPIAVGFLLVKSSKKFLREENESWKIFWAIFAGIIILSTIFTCWSYYKQEMGTAVNFGATGIYEQQWQKAMQWVRDETPENSVFAHWWDYGYWLQSLGERATVLDGGNAIGYWNHLMGRHVLTGTNEDEKERMEYLYTHNTTHLLIDSTDIGKYTAFSSIGADATYDRYSWISTFIMDDSQTQETNNATYYVYRGGIVGDENIVWQEEGKDILLPRRNYYTGALIVKKDETGKITQLESIYVYNNKQYRIPLRYLYYNNKLIDFGSGIEAGAFVYPSYNADGKNTFNEFGAAFYLSERTINSRIARLYLFGEQDKNFKIAHIEDDIAVEDFKRQGASVNHFLQYQGFRGPIKIWEINYPSGIQMNNTYLKTEFPDLSVTKISPGEY